MVKKRTTNVSILILLSTLIFIILLLPAGPLQAQQQDTIKKDAPNVYLDCPFCNSQQRNHIKRELDYVNYMRDRKDADVHIMITREGAANGGHRFSLYIIGQRDYSHMGDTLRFNVGPQASEEQTRQKALHALRNGMAPYLLKTPLWENMSVQYSGEEETEGVKDKWNYWVFEIAADGRVNGEESTRGYDVEGELKANKVTKDIKLQFEFDADNSRQVYEVDDSETITSIHRSYDFDGLAVWSLSRHWSAGGFTGLRSSTYENLDLAYNAAPALEFNVFPYSQSTTRQLTILYRPGFVHNSYRDTTIFNRMSQDLFRESLKVNYEVRKEWGSIDLSMDFSHYFHDFSKNRLNFHSSFNVNVARGLNVYFYGGGSLIHDQISLPQGDATREEILTRQQQLATSYNYYTGFGVSYTFGSMYNNIVNPRF